jgi:hypothetical protein
MLGLLEHGHISLRARRQVVKYGAPSKAVVEYD